MSSKKVLITGANRGLGLAFTQKFLSKGFIVFAGARRPNESPALQALSKDYAQHLYPVALDVSSAESIQAAKATVLRTTDQLDILINNAGRYGRTKSSDLELLDIDEVHKTLETNTLGPLRMAKAFLPLLRKGSDKKIIHITSLMGSIEDNRSGGSYGYRLSKVALNMVSKNLAIDLKGDGILSIVLHPGWVKTDMGGGSAPLEIETSVSGMMKVIETLSRKESGGFYRYDGSAAPW